MAAFATVKPRPNTALNAANAWCIPAGPTGLTSGCLTKPRRAVGVRLSELKKSLNKSCLPDV